MKGFGAAIAAALAFASSAAAITPITVKGNAFFQGSQRFYLRGVDYQPGGSSTPADPLAVPQTCKRDIAMFKKLGINTVRVYQVDNTANHDFCMGLLASAGIYVALDVNNGLYSINRANPGPSYNNIYLKNVFATVDAFQKYDNLLLFFSGNEVINTATNTNCAPYIKAVTRDVKGYIQARGYRSIPVGYAAADVAQNRYQVASYMNCGPSAVRSDFFSINSYSWCDPSSLQTSGWLGFTQLYANYSIPLFLSEYGCITNPPRLFQEVGALYGSVMTPVYSGGLAYEYTEEPSNPGYGLVNVISQSKVTPRQPDFNNFMSQLAQNPPPSGGGGYKTNLPPLACPPYSPNWDVHGDNLPAIPAPALQYFKNGAGGGYGLHGPGSQNTGVDSTGTVPPGPVATGAGSSSSAASGLRPARIEAGPLACGAVAVVSSLLAAALL